MTLGHTTARGQCRRPATHASVPVGDICQNKLAHVPGPRRHSGDTRSPM
jgi:hypothetical protein